MIDILLHKLIISKNKWRTANNRTQWNVELYAHGARSYTECIYMNGQSDDGIYVANNAHANIVIEL